MKRIIFQTNKLPRGSLFNEKLLIIDYKLLLKSLYLSPSYLTTGSRGEIGRHAILRGWCH